MCFVTFAILFYQYGFCTVRHLFLAVKCLPFFPFPVFFFWKPLLFNFCYDILFCFFLSFCFYFLLVNWTVPRKLFLNSSRYRAVGSLVTNNFEFVNSLGFSYRKLGWTSQYSWIDSMNGFQGS